MKKKTKVPKRNFLVVVALIKTGSGKHCKSNKALRKQEKQKNISIYYGE